MYINIEDYTEDKFNMKAEDEFLEISPWIILNLGEIGTAIAYNLFDAEYNITQEILDEEINDYLSDWHNWILEQAIEKLEQNGINVL